MTSIFNAIGPRQAFTFQTRSAYIPMGTVDVNGLTGSETFLIEFSTGGPILIDLSLNSPYVDTSALVTELKSQINSGVGAGVAYVITYSSDQIAFYDVADGYISTNIEDTHFQSFPLPVLTRVPGTYASYDVALGGSPSPPQAGSTILKINGLSDMYTILPGINEITLWTTVENANEDDLSSAVLFVAWTNGVDGVISDGYYEELMFETSQMEDIIQNPPNLDQFTISTKLASAFVLSGTAINVQKKASQQFSLKVPSGATGVYVWAVGTNGNIRLPITMQVAITSATR